MSDILVVGSLAYDSIQTPTGKVDKTLGGSANYFSLAASLFAPVRVVGVVGEDYRSEDKALLQKRKIDLEGLQVQKGKTFHWAGSYEGDMNEAITHATELNVFEHFNPELPVKYRSSEFVFLANIAPELQTQVLSQVEKPVFVGMDTMNFWIQSRVEALKKVLAKVDVVLINEKESMQLTGSSNAISAAKKVCELGPDYVVIKRGEYGFVLFSRSEGFFIWPAYPVEKVVDPTGAGDTFAGGFFGYLASLGRKPNWTDVKAACVRGTVLASFTIQEFGVAAIARTTPEDVETQMVIYHKLVQI